MSILHQFRGPGGGFGLTSYNNARAAGIAPIHIANAIGSSGMSLGWRARDAIIRDSAQQAFALKEQRNSARSDANNYSSQIEDFKKRLSDYETRVTGLQDQYNTAMGQVKSWTDKANEYQAQAADWEDQFNRRTLDFEAAQAEAQMYRDEAVGQQLRALRSGATSGGGNQTQGGASLTGGRQSVQRYDDDAIEVEKNIKAESGALSTKGPVVQKINTANRRQTGPQGAPNQNLASGAGGGGYYASRFG